MRNNYSSTYLTVTGYEVSMRFQVHMQTGTMGDPGSTHLQPSSRLESTFVNKVLLSLLDIPLSSDDAVDTRIGQCLVHRSSAPRLDMSAHPQLKPRLLKQFCGWSATVTGTSHSWRIIACISTFRASLTSNPSAGKRHSRHPLLFSSYAARFVMLWRPQILK